MKLKGISLIETIIVLTLFSSILLLTMPIAVAQLQGDDAENSARQLVDYMFDAQQSAYNRKNRNTATSKDRCFGISFADISQRRYVTFFADWDELTSTCGTRDEIYVPIGGKSTITPSTTEIIFTPGSLKPNTTGNILFKNNATTYTVYITDEGAIYYR